MDRIKGLWIPMYKNDYYFVNPFDGQIMNKYGRILKGRNIIENEKVKCKYISIKTDKGIKSIKEHRIVAEAVLKRDLTGIPIGHKNHLNNDNRFCNLIIGAKSQGNRTIRIIEYKNNKKNKVYKSIRELERETGVSHHNFKNKDNYKIGIYEWLKLEEDK